MSEDKKKLTPPEMMELETQIMNAMKTVYDPEIPVDIWELGMIYDISIDDDYVAHIKMTLTTPNCPVAGSLPGEVERRVRDVQKRSKLFDRPYLADLLLPIQILVPQPAAYLCLCTCIHHCFRHCQTSAHNGPISPSSCHVSSSRVFISVANPPMEKFS